MKRRWQCLVIDATDGGLPIAAMVPQASSEPEQSDAGHMPVPFVPPPASGEMGDVVEMIDSTMQSRQLEPTDAAEPSAKRQRLSVSRISNEVMFHVDETEFGDANDFDLTCYDDFDDLAAWTDDEYVEGGDFASPSGDELWFPYSIDERAVYGETLQDLDRTADEVESK